MYDSASGTQVGSKMSIRETSRKHNAALAVVAVIYHRRPPPPPTTATCGTALFSPGGTSEG